MKVLIFIGLVLNTVNVWASDAAIERLKEYSSQVTEPFSAVQGKQIWIQSYRYNTGVKQRSCVSCHGEDLSKAGKHLRTKKEIKPMSRQTNPSALTDSKKIEKWFKRNCKWTMGRECSVKEKGDVLTYLLTGVEK